VGTKGRAIVAAMKKTLKNPRKLPTTSPYGEGTAAEKIVEIVRRELAC
jgi:UDP-N-acetylglucosamine 2-epimerase